MRQQKIVRQPPKKQVEIIDERQHSLPEIPKGIDKPVRAVMFVEVGDMEAARVAQFMEILSAQYRKAQGGIHYIIPIRHGKIPSDILFEKEFLEVVNKLCTVDNGEIVMKDDYEDVHVIRTKI